MMCLVLAFFSALGKWVYFYFLVHETHFARVLRDDAYLTHTIVSSVQEFLGFFASTLADRTAAGVRQAVEQDVYVGYVYTHPTGLVGVMVTDHEYPQRVAFTVINKILDEFLARYPRISWSAGATVAGSTTSLASSTRSSASTSASGSVPNTPFPALKEYIVRYQNPHEADSILRVQKELDETKVVLHKTIESLLDRGEKLDTLVDKSERLSAQSKGFYKVARRTNTCCWLQ